MKRHLSVAGFLGLILLAVASGAAAEEKGGPAAHTKKHCENVAAEQRGECVECVSRATKHHYHPSEPAGSRCHPNGK